MDIDTGAKQMSDQLEVLDDADLDAVNGGFASHSTVWMACYFTARDYIGKAEDAWCDAMRNPS